MGDVLDVSSLEGGLLSCYDLENAAVSETRLWRNFLAMVFFSVLCAAFYYISYAVLTRKSKVFNMMSLGDKADCAARTYSTLHALVVSNGLLAVAISNSLWLDVLGNKAHTAEIFFAFSCGYFAFDCWVVASTRLDNWIVFVVHHICGVMPYATACFWPGCANSYYLLCIGMMVEYTNPLINALWWMDKYKKSHLNVYSWTLYCHFGMWIVVRQLLPAYLTYLIITVVSTSGLCLCAIPIYITAIFVVPFCTYVFATILTPELTAHIRSKAKRRRKRMDLLKKRRPSTGISEVAEEFDEGLGRFTDSVEDAYDAQMERLQPYSARMNEYYEQMPDMPELPEPPARVREAMEKARERAKPLMDGMHERARPVLDSLPNIDLPRNRKNLPHGL
ncbi:hypothetical protein SARC_07664 [Sphaeroforma arctica JP610]|uniref:TLC domain-containing protein n=1 Tax=Sphaeroforma arctica JP610 TaxID=667725 RepID=A0A0L0FTR2_9EUKA|nr:hypothetical protein SARC_07664 [Sphaeroforma arctica JP610]KNC79966.1 hypothetical protein SARC_07664 [Sphaeroforma arctica JP610]|eukprot:XP_014153868.1 hypothetical protein SARC_07664 [Sphaeroforma arctica JP610]